MSEIPKPSKIETEECFVIKCINGEYIIGEPMLMGGNFHSFDICIAIRQFSFKTYKDCENHILYMEQRYSNWIKQWHLQVQPALKPKEPSINLLKEH